MMQQRVVLYGLENIMLLVEHRDGPTYQAQVGGVLCWQEELQGVLCPIGIDSTDAERIASLPYFQGRQGITTDIADAIDAILVSRRVTEFVRVDRSRLDDSWEAWVYVTISSPEHGISKDELRVAIQGDLTYFGPLYGFGNTRGVLTWPNSD